MKKAIFLLLLAVLAVSATYAFEIDGEFSSYTAGESASINTIDILETAKASLGLVLPLDFNKNTNLKIAGDVSAKWKVNSTDADFIADCTELSLLMAIPLGESSYGSFEMGRFSAKDSTELIFNQNIDGVRFLVDSPTFKAHLYGGYTGLLNAHHNPMIPSQNPTGVYPTAPSYITASVYTYLPDIYEDKSIGLEVLGAFNPVSPSATKIYAIARIDGKFLYFIPYTLCSAFSWTNANNSFGHMANLSFASMEYTINKTHFGGKLLHASGNSDNFSDFKQLSKIFADKYDSFLFSNLMSIGFFVDNTTSGNVNIGFNADTLFSLDTEKNLVFSGFQWDFNINIPITAKTKLVFDLHEYIPVKAGNLNTTLSMFLSFGF